MSLEEQAEVAAAPLSLEEQAEVTAATLSLELLNWFNSRYAIARHGGSAVVIDTEEIDEFGMKCNQITSYENFKKSNSHKTMCVGAKQTMIPAAPLWLDSHAARRYEQVMFYPTRPGQDPQDFPLQNRSRPIFNLFKGWPLSLQVPPGASCESYLNLLLHGMCSGEEEDYEYLLNVMACMIQFPDKKTEVCVVFKSGQGTGKGIFLFRPSAN